jgi:hypothetical protein
VAEVQDKIIVEIVDRITGRTISISRVSVNFYADMVTRNTNEKGVATLVTPEQTWAGGVPKVHPESERKVTIWGLGAEQHLWEKKVLYLKPSVRTRILLDRLPAVDFYDVYPYLGMQVLAHAQHGTGIRLVEKDSARVIVGAPVKILNNNNAIEASGKTNSEGVYSTDSITIDPGFQFKVISGFREVVDPVDPYKLKTLYIDDPVPEEMLGDKIGSQETTEIIDSGETAPEVEEDPKDETNGVGVAVLLGGAGLIWWLMSRKGE